jgi:nucleolar complex protein 2
MDMALKVSPVHLCTSPFVLSFRIKSTYLALIRACKSTSAHTLPSINLMKNSASELYTMDPAMAYQHAFGYIRQLAILLRNGLKVKSKVSARTIMYCEAAYNWLFLIIRHLGFISTGL